MRIDIAEALAVAFSEAQVLAMARLDGTIDALMIPDVVILDTPLGEMKTSALINAWTQAGAQIILTDSVNQSGLERPQAWRTVDRPFTDQMLIDAIGWSD